MTTQAELLFAALDDEYIHAVYNSEENVIVLDVQKLCRLVTEKVRAARKVGLHLGDSQIVFICKFSSIVSHEIIHEVLTKLEGDEVSKKFDRPYFPEFMGKIPEGSIDMALWSDAFETSPIGDTWLF